jgi:hypothetical protein
VWRSVIYCLAYSIKFFPSSLRRAYVEERKARNEWGTSLGGMQGQQHTSQYGFGGSYRSGGGSAPSGMNVPGHDWSTQPPKGGGFPSSQFDIPAGFSGGMPHPGMSYPPTNMFGQPMAGMYAQNNVWAGSLQSEAPHSDPFPAHSSGAAQGMRLEDPEEEEFTLGPGMPPNRPVGKLNAPNAMGPAS